MKLPGIVADGVGTVDLSDAAATLSGMVDGQVIAMANELAGKGFEGHIQITEGENGVKAEFVITGLGTGRKSGGGGGGGGGGKSAVEKLLENQEKENKLYEHKIKMIQFEETRYENMDELKNQAIMIQHEIDAEQELVKIKEKQLET